MDEFIKLYLFEKKDKKDKKIYKLDFKSSKEDDWEMKDFFYVLSADFSPIPPGMVVICVQNNPNPPHNTISMNIAYDLYNYPECSLKFITFIIPQPYTNPLYIHNDFGGLYLSIREENKNLERHLISPLSVILEKSNKLTVDWKKGEEIDFPPNFKLDDTNRCIPSKDGTTLKNCVKTIKKNNLPPLNLLDVLTKIQNKRILTINRVIIILLCIVSILIGTYRGN